MPRKPPTHQKFAHDAAELLSAQVRRMRVMDARALAAVNAWYDRCNPCKCRVIAVISHVASEPQQLEHFGV